MRENNFIIIQGEASEQGSSTWHEFRKGKIGSSDVSAIMGASPWETKLQCWERMVFGIEREATPAMRRGSALEARARDMLNKQTGRDYKPVVLQSLAHPDLIASLDAFWISPEGKIHIAEIKNPGQHDHQIAITGGIPDKYFYQLTHQTDLSSADECLYVSWDGTADKVVIVNHEQDEYEAVNLFTEILSFMASIYSLKPPEPTDRDWVNINDSRVIEASLRYKELSSKKELIEMEMKLLKDSITKIASHPRSRIGDMSLQKIIRKGAVDYEKMMDDYNITSPEKYRKEPIEMWRLS